MTPHRATNSKASTTSHSHAASDTSLQAAFRPPSRSQYPTAAFLQGLSTNARDAVLSAAAIRRFTGTTIVTHQGELANQLFLLIKGSARYFFITPGGTKVYLLWLMPGEIFGATSLLARTTPFIVSTEVEKNTTVLVWQRGAILDLTNRYPLLLHNALSAACDYLVWYVASHLSLISHNGQRRLANVLATLATGFGEKGVHGVSLAVTNEQLANAANITHFTVSRLLSRWHREGVLVKSRGRLLLRDPKLLFRTRSDYNHQPIAQSA